MKHIITTAVFLLIANVSSADPALEISATQTGHHEYSVKITNVSTNDVVFRIGENVGNGRYIYYDALVLNLRDANGHVHEIVSRGDNLSVIGGRVDPLYMTLTPNSALSINVDQSNWFFFMLPDKEFTHYHFSLDTTQDKSVRVPIQFYSANLLDEVFVSPKYKITPNQRVDPTVKTPVESGKVQGTAGHP
jgi:hypothetical protein